MDAQLGVDRTDRGPVRRAQHGVLPIRCTSNWEVAKPPPAVTCIPEIELLNCMEKPWHLWDEHLIVVGWDP
jgi:hypothetical protein